ncbi:MAG: hypothetical protein HMLKMBBP_00320 [Planctomycetes bacterium]|nr:hypothetical protein [Planctomycetota bacterium]
MTGGAPLKVTVVGCGRLGALLAERLSRSGSDVVVVDTDPAAFLRLPPSFGGFRICGNAVEIDVLRRARAEGADMVLATTRDDNLNLFVTQAAVRVLGARRAVARVFEPTRESTYRALGVETICPTTIAAGAFIDRVAGAASRKDG